MHRNISLIYYRCPRKPSEKNANPTAKTIAGFQSVVVARPGHHHPFLPRQVLALPATLSLFHAVLLPPLACGKTTEDSEPRHGTLSLIPATLLVTLLPLYPLALCACCARPIMLMLWACLRAAAPCWSADARHTADTGVFAAQNRLLEILVWSQRS